MILLGRMPAVHFLDDPALPNLPTGLGRAFLRDVHLYLQPVFLLSASRDFQIDIKDLFECLAFQGSGGQIIRDNAAFIDDHNAVCKAGGQVEIVENDEGAQLWRQKLPHRRERVDLVPYVQV